MTDTGEKKSAEFEQPGLELGELQSQPTFSPEAEKRLVRKVDLMYVALPLMHISANQAGCYLLCSSPT